MDDYSVKNSDSNCVPPSVVTEWHTKSEDPTMEESKGTTLVLMSGREMSSFPPVFLSTHVRTEK